MNLLKKLTIPVLGLSMLLYSCGNKENTDTGTEDITTDEVLVDDATIDMRLKPVVIEADIKDPASRTYMEVGEWVSAEVPANVAGEGMYNYADMLSADFDGDGSMEKLVLTSDIEVENGVPQWKPENIFQVYIKDGATIHRLYGNKLQFGSVKVYYSENKNAIHILSKVGEEDKVYEVKYKDGNYMATATGEIDAQSKVLKID